MTHLNLHQDIRKTERGQGLVEYALILVLVAVVVIAILSLMGPTIGNIFSSVVNALKNPQAQAQPCTITTNLASGSLVLVVPANILNKSVSSNGAFYWGGTGNDRIKNSTMSGTPSLAQGSTKAWRLIVVSAVGNCSPFPNK